MAENELYAVQRPARAAVQSGRTARPSADTTERQLRALKAEANAQAAAEAKFQADLRASLTADAKPKTGILSRLFGR